MRRSASSSTSIVIAPSLTLFDETRSRSRPVVLTSRSTALSIALSCSSRSPPPYTAADRIEETRRSEPATACT
eukprot:4674870-Pleurochrysis_carterae.AAC.2